MSASARARSRRSGRYLHAARHTEGGGAQTGHFAGAFNRRRTHWGGARLTEGAARKKKVASKKIADTEEAVFLRFQNWRRGWRTGSYAFFDRGPKPKFCFYFLMRLAGATERPKCPWRASAYNCSLFDSWQGADDGREMAGRARGPSGHCANKMLSYNSQQWLAWSARVRLRPRGYPLYPAPFSMRFRNCLCRMPARRRFPPPVSRRLVLIVAGRGPAMHRYSCRPLSQSSR
jgi:hypothetical protein